MIKHSVLLGHNNESQKRLSGNQKAFPLNRMYPHQTNIKGNGKITDFDDA